jgi:predicted RNase H-like HicB family nuclease
MATCWRPLKKLFQLQETIEMQDYHINIFYSQEDSEYVADIPDLKYCSVTGVTPEEALREVLIAKALWLEVGHEKGWPIPAPRYRPIIYQIAP